MADDDDIRECFPEMSELYLEAARRLPIADIPDLARCLQQRGLAVGLCDPVTTILLTTIHAFTLEIQHLPRLRAPTSREEALRLANDRLSFLDAVHRSRLGQLHFMLCYFRHLTRAEAGECLAAAGHDIPLAVLLVQRSCGGDPDPAGHPDLDSATTKEALTSAFRSAWCSAPQDQDLVRLMTARYQRHALPPVLDVLRCRKQLSADWVYRIGHLLCHPCPCSPPPPVPPMLITPPRAFRDANGQVTTTIVLRNDPAFIMSRLQDHASMSVTIVSSSTPTHGNGNGNDNDGTVHLSAALAERRVYVDYDDRFCSWEGHVSTWFLKMSLLDTMHELYITALARLPVHALHHCHLLRAVLTAGHSYGPMRHPVANIIFNSLWYDALFPFILDDDDETPAAADIIDPCCMSRVESRSLDAILALLCSSYCVTQREALEQLCKDRGDLDLWARDFMFVIDDVLLAAKHPQPAAYKTFVQGLTSAQLNHMQGLIITDQDQDQAISDNAVNQLKEMITKIAAGRGIAARLHTIAPALSRSTLEILSANRSDFKIEQDYVRRNLKVLLDDYSLREGQKYHVGLICGVASSTYGYPYSGSTCYHVNFLASIDIGVPNDATPTPMHKLFFAEFWSHADQRIEESKKPPICCALEDYPKHFGRCNVCESSYSTIVHPPCCGYFMDTSRSVFPTAESLAEADLEADPGMMLDMDFVYYFDAEKDHIEEAAETQFPV